MQTEDDLKTLKQDAFGAIEFDSNRNLVRRNTTRAGFGVRFLARRLAAREAQALIALNTLQGIPSLLHWDGKRLDREHLDGQILYEHGHPDERWFRQASSLLRQMHRYNIAHNDLAKEANCLVLADGSAAFIDFQLAVHAPGRGYVFRQLAREDIRHLLKHKRCYMPDKLTARERAILANPGLAAKAWMVVYKPAYNWFTRSILRWPERTGPAERVSQTNKQD